MVPPQETLLIQLKSRGILHSECTLGPEMSGTTQGKVYVINLHDQPIYVLKMDDPLYVFGVTLFLQAYEGALIPKLHYRELENGFFIYEYAAGAVNKDKGPKSIWLSTLSESLINRYERASAEEGWGWLEEPLCDSWITFLHQCIEEARQRIGNVLSEDDHNLVLQLPESIYGANPPEAYLLHGDCGVHNFIFESSTLRGVIDPTPMIGPPLYDFIFAFCSSPDELTWDTLLEAVSYLSPSVVQHADRRILIEEVIVQLYCRIATCIKYHSYHLPAYVGAWSYWRKLREADGKAC